MQLTNLTRRILPALLGLILCTSIYAQDNLIFEDFEDASVTYTTNPVEFSDGSGDFFTRTDGSNITGSYSISGIQGTSYFAAQDVDGDQTVIPVELEFTGDISSHTDLDFSILLAEDSPNAKWDANDFVYIDYSIDGGSYLPLIHIRNDGTTFNTVPQIDSDFDGIGDGAALTDALTSYSALIAETGNSITIRIQINLDSGDEDIAFDNVLLTGTLASDPGDNEPPVAICAALGTATAELDENGVATVNAEALDGGSTDNVGVASFEANPSSFSCADIGSQPVTLTVFDTNGNSATCTTDVQVVDLLGPVLSVNDEITVTLDANGNVAIDPNIINNGTTDNCGVNAISVNPNALSCSDAFNPNPLTEDLIISEYVEGSSNNKYIEIFNGTGHAVDMAEYALDLYSNGATDPTSSENLGVAGILENGETAVFSNSQANIYSGTHYNSSVAGFNGNDLVLLSRVTPNFNQPVDIFGIFNDNPGTAWTDGVKSTADQTLRRKKDILKGNTDPFNQNFLDEWDQFDQDDVSDLGMHHVEDTPASVTFSATDNSGNVSTKTISVKVMDTSAPHFLSQIDDIVIPPADGYCTQQIFYTYPEVEDNCSGEVVITSDHPSGSTFFSGETLVTVTATDPSGNTDQVQFTVTIEKDPLTLAVWSDQDYVCHYQEGLDGRQGVDINSETHGGCWPYTYTWNGVPGPSGKTTIIGGTYTLVVTDANGDTASGTVTLSENPTITFDVDVINPSCINGHDGSAEVSNVQGSDAGDYIITWYLEQLGRDGDYRIDSIGPSISNLDPNIIKAYIVDTTVYCETVKEFLLITEDRTPPTAICGSTTLILDASGTAILDPSDLNNGSTDDCGTLSFSASQNIFDCTNLGDNEVTLYVADDSLNTSTCVANVTVIDNLPPELAANSSMNFTLDNSGQVVIDATLFDNGSTDNCGITEFSVDPATLSCADIGEGAPLSPDLIISEYLEGSSSNKYIEVYNGTGAPVDLSNYELHLYSNGSSSVSSSGDLSTAGTLATGQTAIFRNSAAFIYSGTSFANTAVNFNGDDAIALFNTNTGQNVDVFGVIGLDPGTEWTSGSKSAKDHTLRRISTITSGNTNPTNANFIDEYEQYDQDDVSGLGAHSLSGGGGTEITFTATDASGNSTSTIVTAVVIDNTAPVFSNFPTDITADTDPETCSATVNWTEPTATDNCEATLESDHASGESFGAGETTVTYTATDPSGNTTSQSFTITVTSQNLMAEVVIDDNIHCNGGIATVHAEITGGCQPYTYTWDGVDGTETQTVSAGDHTLILTDVNGNVSNKDFSISQPSALMMTLDATNPTCGSISDGEITAIVTGGTPSYSIIWSGDAIGTSNTLSSIGNGTYTATVTDIEGCTLSQSVTLNGVDTIPPVLQVGNSMRAILATGVTSVLEPWNIDNGSYDNCGTVTLTVSDTIWDCSQLGYNPVTVTGTDEAGNVSTAIIYVIVEDSAHPWVLTADIDLPLNADGQAHLEVADIDRGSFDNCGIATLEITDGQVDYTCAEVGETFTVTLTATDPYGNTYSNTAQVTIVDTTTPEFTSVPEDITATADAATCSAMVTWTAPEASDNCTVSVTSDYSSGDAFPAGVTTVTYTAADLSGNSVTESFTVTVSPEELVVSLSTDQSILCNGGTTTVSSVVTGGCQPYTYSWDGVSGSESLSANAGLHTLMVTDANGASASANVTLTEPSALEATLSAIEPSCGQDTDGEVSAAVSGGTAPYSIVWSGDATGSGSTLLNLGNGTYTATVTDTNGCTAVESITIDVLDETPPTAICGSATLYLDEYGEATLDPNDIDMGSSDNCGNLILTVSKTDFYCWDLGDNNVILTATDEAGMTSTCTAMVTVADSISPVFVDFPGDITVASDPSACSAVVTWAEIDALENCTVYILYDHTSGDTFPVGETTVTYTATDVSGNTVSQSFTVTVTAEELLVSISQDQDILCHGGSANVSAVVSGGCQPYTYSWDGASGGASLSANAGLHTLTVTDGNGASASANITLTEPSALAVTLTSTEPSCGQSTDGEVSAAGSGGTPPYTVEWNGDATGSGNTLSNLGNGTYTATVTDANGCPASESVTLNGTDITPPTAICGNATLYLDAQGHATLDPADMDGGSSDNCGSVSLSASQTAFDCADLGDNEITLTVTDGAGMTSTCTATVTVVDNLAPVVITQDINVSLDLTGFALVGITEINNGTSDNCGLASLQITSGQTQYGCDDIGQTFAVTLTASDFSGNQSSSVAQVTVVPGSDSDGDGVSDACDICEGDDSLGDADGDGICDELQQFCPGGEAIANPNLDCDIQTTAIGTFNANQNQIYCINGPFVNQNIKLTNGSTVRLSGNGVLRLSIGTNCAVEIMSGSTITFQYISMGWNARGLVVHPGAEMSINGFAPNEPVVNCGTINCYMINMGYNSSFLNNGTVNTTDINFANQSGFINNGTVNCAKFNAGYGSSFANNGVLNSTGANKNNILNGTLLNYGTVDIAGQLTQSYNGHIDNYCTILIGKDFNVGKDVKNYALVSVGGKSKLSYNGRVLLYNGAMFQTYSTQISGRYIGYGAPSLVKVLAITKSDWNGKVQGSIYFCDANGIEYIQNPNGLTINGAQKSCDLNIPISDCNPIGNIVAPSGLVMNGDNSHSGSDALQTGVDVPSNGFANPAGTQGKMDAITVFPNPTEGKARITFTPLFDTGVTISVYNVNGQKLQEFKPAEQIAGQPYEARIDLSKYDNGVYFIQIMDQARAETKKLVLAK